MKIYKYQLLPHGVTELEMPACSQIISAQCQGDIATIWASVPDDERKEALTKRRIICLTTGQTFSMSPNVNLGFIDTVQLAGGAYVVHVFEVIKRK